MNSVNDSPHEASANRTAMKLYLLAVLAGVASAILMFWIARRSPYIECHFWLGRSFLLSLGVTLVSTTLGLVFRRVAYLRRILLTLVIYFCVFQLCNALFLFADIKQYQSKQGRVGSSYSMDASVDDILRELRLSLLANDTRSEIRIEDCREISNKEAHVKASWQKNEQLENVLSHLKTNAIVDVKVDTSGNPESLGFVHGLIYTLWLYDKKSEPSRL